MNMDDFMKDEPTGPLCRAKAYSGNPKSKSECKRAFLELHPDKNPDCAALAKRKYDKIQPECARMGLGQGRGGSMPLGHNQPLAKKERPNTIAGSAIRGYGTAGSRVTGMNHSLIPVAQLPSKIGGGRFSKKGNYIGPSTGAIIPNLQSNAAPAGSGKMSRGAMVARLMKEKGISLAEASKQLKGGAYTANNFFMPKNFHDFLGAYS